MASPLTIQPSGKDNFLDGNSVTTNYGTEINLDLMSYTHYNMRPILSFDASGYIGGSANITSAKLYLYMGYIYSGNPTGLQVNCCKITRNDWTELYSTWNRYKSGTNWTTAGGDYVTTNPAMGTYTPINNDLGWWEWNIKDIVVDSIDNVNSIVNLLIRFNTENTGMCRLYLASKEYPTTALRPKLVIVYTETDIKSVNGLVIASVKSKNGLAIADIKSFNGIE